MDFGLKWDPKPAQCEIWRQLPFKPNRWFSGSTPLHLLPSSSMLVDFGFCIQRFERERITRWIPTSSASRIPLLYSILKQMEGLKTLLKSKRGSWRWRYGSWDVKTVGNSVCRFSIQLNPLVEVVWVSCYSCWINWSLCSVKCRVSTEWEIASWHSVGVEFSYILVGSWLEVLQLRVVVEVIWWATDSKITLLQVQVFPWYVLRPCYELMVTNHAHAAIVGVLHILLKIAGFVTFHTHPFEFVG